MRRVRTSIVAATVVLAASLAAASTASAQILTLPNLPTPPLVIPIPALPGLPTLPSAPVEVTPGGPPTLGLFADQDPIEDNAFPFAVIFTRTEAQPPTQRVIVTVKPLVQGSACAGRALDDPGREVLDIPTPGDSDRIVDNAILVTDPGPYLVCGWLQDPPDGSPAIATDGGSFTAREPRSSISVGAPGSVALADSIPVSLGGSAEIGRSATILMRPQASGPPTCAATAAGERSVGAGPVLQGTLTGTGTLTALAAPRAIPGAYLLCGYLGEGFDDPTPEARASATTQVNGPPACTLARTTIADPQAAADGAVAGAAFRARLIVAANDRVVLARRVVRRAKTRRAKRVATRKLQAARAVVTEQTALAATARKQVATTQAALAAARAAAARACA